MGNLISSLSSTAPEANQYLHNIDIPPSVDLSSEPLEISLRHTLIQFLKTIDYSFTSYPESKDLELAVRNEILSFGIDLRPQWEARLRTSCALVGMAYIKHPVEIQFSIAILTWFGFTMDDCTNKEDPGALATFQHRYLTSQSQLDPFFDHFAAHLNKIWGYYHPIAANSAVSALIDYANGCSLEIVTEGMKISPAAAHYPDYVRHKSGVADFYAFGLWPAAQFPDIRAYVQAVPAISRFANIVNDILSFYKEELAGETVNYVHLLQTVRHKESVLEIVHDLIDEAVGLSDEVSVLLADEAKEPWERYKTGYITWHLCDSRYKLSELGLNEENHHASNAESPL